MVGVSLTIAVLLVLCEKSLLLKCFAVLQLGFFLETKNILQKCLLHFKGIF